MVRQRRHRAATAIQCLSRGWAGKRRAHQARRSRLENEAARKLQVASRVWLGLRQAKRRGVLRKIGACALCCVRLPEMFFEATEQVRTDSGGREGGREEGREGGG